MTHAPRDESVVGATREHGSLRLRRGERVLFIGDSNTDTQYRTRVQPLGYGYVMMFDAFLAARHPDLALDLMNRGNDGDTVLHLAQRWDDDVLAHEPDWLFIMIGTNDVGCRYMETHRDRAVDDATFASTLRELVDRTPDRTRVVLIEPPMFDLPVDDAPNRDLQGLCRILERTAADTGCERVEVFRGMADAQANGAAWWFQNVNHPHMRGHAFLAQQVLRHVGWTF